ncbi:MAG: ATP-binding protein [Sandaracinaceae bacterium]
MSALEALSFASLEGQGPAREVLERAVAHDRLASSYLFEGPSGVGKRRAALALAAHVIGADESIARRIGEGTYPDVRVFGPRDEGRRNIQVDTLRTEILPIAQFAPFEARAAFLVFDEADVCFPDTPPEPANALLKTLEEPRRNVHFILLSERPDRLLPTIRSRCQRVRFARLSPERVDAILAARGIPEEKRGPAIALADGRADRAIALAEGDAEALLDQALALDDACFDGGPGALVRASEALVRSDVALTTALEAWMAFQRDLAAAALGLPDATLAFRHRADTIRARGERLGAARAARRVELIQEALFALERNGNPQIVVDALLFDARL